MIGELTRSVNYLKESEFRRGQWLDKAKKEAGKVLHHNEYYFGIGSSSRSFDDVWKEMLDNVQPVD